MCCVYSVALEHFAAGLAEMELVWGEFGGCKCTGGKRCIQGGKYTRRLMKTNDLGTDLPLIISPYDDHVLHCRS